MRRAGRFPEALAICDRLADECGDEVAATVRLYEQEAARYRDRPDAAAKLATDPLGPLADGADPAEMAAWTVVGNVLLNQDGVLTRG